MSFTARGEGGGKKAKGDFLMTCLTVAGETLLDPWTGRYGGQGLAGGVPHSGQLVAGARPVRS